MTYSEYLRARKVWDNQLAAVGRPIDDKDLISFIISGINPTYNSFITSYIFVNRENPLSFEDFQDEILNHEMLLNQQDDVTSDSSTFVLFTQRPGIRQYQLNSKGKMSQQFKYSPHGQQSKYPTYGFSGPQQKSGMSFNSNAAGGLTFILVKVPTMLMVVLISTLLMHPTPVNLQ